MTATKIETSSVSLPAGNPINLTNPSQVNNPNWQSRPRHLNVNDSGDFQKALANVSTESGLFQNSDDFEIEKEQQEKNIQALIDLALRIFS